jgi:hypothetical protein
LRRRRALDQGKVGVAAEDDPSLAGEAIAETVAPKRKRVRSLLKPVATRR